MNSGDKGSGDHPLDMVEQLQIRLKVDNQTLGWENCLETSAK